MYDFGYHRPASVTEAAGLVAADADCKVLAGGQTLIPTLKQRLAMPTALVDLGAVPGLDDITLDGGVLTIGAMTRHATVAASATVAEVLPALAHLAGLIGDAQVRNRGTLGGSVANADPAADYPAALLALGATVITDRRRIAAGYYFTGLFETALEAGELVTAVAFPVPRRAGYAKFPNPASRYATVGVFVADTADGVRVAITGAGPSVFRSADLEAALTASFTPEAAAAVKVSADGLNEDMHASAEYRASLIPVMAARAVAAMV